MNGGLETAVPGTIASAGERAGDAHHARGPCPNCGTVLLGDYCHACGQTAHLHRTMFSLWHDLLHGAFHFEGRIWHTLPLLFTRPGELTRRYIAGERTRFVSPLALFLFSVFLTFAVFEATGGMFGHHGGISRDGVALTARQVAAETDSLKAHVAKLKADRAAARARHAETREIDRQIATAQENLAGMRAASVIATGTLDGPAIAADVQTGWPALDERVAAAARSPDLFLYKLQSSAHKFSWALIPISVPFIWLLFAFRRDVGPYDHTVFAMLSLSTMLLGICALSIGAALGLPGAVIGAVLVFGPPFHMYRQLKGAYRLSRFGAVWRTIALVISAYVAAMLFFVLLIGITD